MEHTAAALSRLESHTRRGALAVLLCLPVWPVSAQQTDTTPSGMVAYFMTSGVGCPREWSAPANAQGRVLVGFSDPAAIGATVRSPMLPQTAPVHSHTFTTTVTLDQKYIAALDWWGSDSAAGHGTYDIPQSPPGHTNGGTAETANLPFIQLVVCQKN